MVKKKSKKISEKELKVLNLMKDGKYNNQIAEEIYLSTSTVKFYASSVIHKLNAQNRTQAVYIAAKLNII